MRVHVFLRGVLIASFLGLTSSKAINAVGDGGKSSRGDISPGTEPSFTLAPSRSTESVHGPAGGMDNIQGPTGIFQDSDWVTGSVHQLAGATDFASHGSTKDCNCVCKPQISVAPSYCPQQLNTNELNNLTDVILSRMVAADEQVTSTQCNYQRRTIAHFPFDDNFREDAATHILVNAPRVGDSQYVKGVKFVPGVFGRCVEFNSPRAKELTYQGGFSTDNNRNYTWNKGFTISVWFRRPESSGEDELGIAGYINGEVGVFELFIGIKDQRSNSSFSQQPTSFGNTWHHVVITSNGETSSERVYIDGLETQRHLMALASYLLISNNVKTAIPNKMDFVISTSQKNDLVDELVIVDCALPPVEVLRMYADYSRRLLVNVGK